MKQGTFWIRLCILIALAISSESSLAKEAQQSITVGGVVLSLRIDEFSERVEITSPKIGGSDGGARLTAFVASIYSVGSPASVFVTGFLIYRGGWRRYDRALIRGGHDLDVTFTGRNVVSCSAYGSSNDCYLSEHFRLDMPLETARELAVNGQVDVQLRASGAHPVMVRIPLQYIESVDAMGTALLEAAKERQ